ncbi:hypothetical protein NKK48_01505 [Mesorhizobium sp. C386A]|uniref:hypothetical protein n=1 Tax=unclassified Mesorhizobium TaxID=325217 RepID=UPI0003CEC560|nr:hypothetical protein [Mesorhizobium sp. LNJC386A00]ESY35757.1 hypothetical protein X748_14190 [Mesorhizobium sp. LNJC386A00]
MFPYVKQGGVWVPAQTFVKTGGVWKRTTTSVRNAGVWATEQLFATDFGEYTVGQAPSDWTSRYGAGTSIAVQSVAGSLSGKALRFTKTSAARNFFSWDRVPQVADVEILARLRSIEVASVAQSILRLTGRASGAALSENCHTAGAHWHSSSGTAWRQNSHVIVNGTSTVLLPQNDAPSPSFVVGNWFWIRFRMQGNSFSYKLWWQGAAEPATFQTYTNTALSTAGYTGISTVEDNPDSECDFFSVATGGATALT